MTSIVDTPRQTRVISRQGPFAVVQRFNGEVVLVRAFPEGATESPPSFLESLIGEMAPGEIRS